MRARGNRCASLDECPAVSSEVGGAREQQPCALRAASLDSGAPNAHMVRLLLIQWPCDTSPVGIPFHA